MSIGIDFGTSKVCAAVYDGRTVDVISNEHDSRLTPCYVGFGEEIQIGETAKSKASMNIQNTVYQIKRFMGCDFEDNAVQHGVKSWGFEVCKAGTVPMVKVQFHDIEREFRTEEMAAIIISKMKEIVENHYGKKFPVVSISVPVCFNDAQLCSMKNAGNIAGFETVNLVKEPTLAAIAYNSSNKPETWQRILVFDLGAGTFDVSLCQMWYDNIRVLASCGDAHLGGDDFDSQIVKKFENEFEKTHGINISLDKKAKLRLRYECEKAKKLLSVSMQASIQVDCLSDGIDFKSSITREEFEHLNKDNFEKIKDAIHKFLKEIEQTPDMIEQVVLIGGSTRIPKVRNILIDVFGEKKLNRTVNADEAVALGAAMYMNVSLRVEDTISRSFYIKDGTKTTLLFKKNSILPIRQKTNDLFPNKVGGETFEVYEETNERRSLIGKFKLLSSCNTNLRMENGDGGMLTFNDKNLERKDEGLRLTKEQVEKMTTKANEINDESRCWLKKNEAVNRLEKLSYAIRKKVAPSEYSKRISELQEQSKSQCDKALEWIKDSKVTELVNMEERIQKVENIWDHFNNERKKEEKDQRLDARTDLFNAIKKIRGEAKTLGGYEKVVQYCTELEEWVEKNMVSGAEMYQEKISKLEDYWKKEHRIKQPNTSALQRSRKHIPETAVSKETSKQNNSDKIENENSKQTTEVQIPGTDFSRGDKDDKKSNSGVEKNQESSPKPPDVVKVVTGETKQNNSDRTENQASSQQSTTTEQGQKAASSQTKHNKPSFRKTVRAIVLRLKFINMAKGGKTSNSDVKEHQGSSLPTTTTDHISVTASSQTKQNNPSPSEKKNKSNNEKKETNPEMSKK